MNLGTLDLVYGMVPTPIPDIPLQYGSASKACVLGMQYRASSPSVLAFPPYMYPTSSSPPELRES